ncbi:MAG: cation transporter [Candidatus Melainabacteria bacterium]|nr:MAG: cation transporter [Candidatus Melainabacteria bacterium]
MDEAIKKKKAAVVSMVSNSSLILIKFIAGFVSGSISIISEAVHSTSDMLASLIAFLAVSESSKPADADHQFGHGKYEYIASLLESILIIMAGFYIVFEGIKKLYTQENYMINPEIGLYVMGFSIVANLFVSKYLFKIAKETNSPALHADAAHLSTDMFSSIAVILGLVLVKITGNVIFDSVVAIIVAIIVLLAGIEIFKKAKENLVDTALSISQTEQIKEIIQIYSKTEGVSLKTLKTRKNGLKKEIEIILLVDGELKVKDAHKICDKIENAIENKLTETEISIHLEPKKQEVSKIY